MKKVLYTILAVTALFFAGCQKEVSQDFDTPGNQPGNNPVTATLQGIILDENGSPAAGATITVGNKTATTDARGYFRIKSAALDKNASLVTAEKIGYFKAFRVFSATSATNHVQIKLLKKSLTGTVTASSGGVVTLTNGSSINFSANSFAKASGGSYSGTVNVYAAYIDPSASDIGEAVPGSFLANNRDNNRVILTSYGMIAVELESPAGEELQVATGSTAKLTVAIPASLQAAAPNSIPLWFVDESTGLWKEEGRATRNGNFYEGDVKHFTYWNCDVPGPTVNVTATIVSQAGTPLVNVYVVFRPLSGQASAHGYTDSEGKISGSVPANIPLKLEISSAGPCHSIVYSQNVGPYTTATNLGTITVNNIPELVTIKGKLLACNNNPVTNGFAEIEIGYMVHYINVNTLGDFAYSYITCGTGTSNCTVTGIDAQNTQQGQPVTVPITAPITDAGNIAACGTSSIQFLNYTIDGNTVNMSSLTPGDTFNQYDTIGSSRVTINGWRPQTQNYFLFSFDGTGNPGTFPATELRIDNISGITIIQPFNIVITQHPASGGYFEGIFSGQYKDGANVTHTANGTFRIRRR